MIRRSSVVVGLLLAIGIMTGDRVGAEPYLAVQTGYKCNICHVNATGGGLRNDFGILFAKLLLPAQTADHQLDAWTGKLAEQLRVGGDLRADWSSASVPGTASRTQFDLQQFRVYADLSLIPDRLGLYVDEQIAPGGSQNQEAYVRYGSAVQGLYIKGGQFYLPFGWRLQDQTAFVREASGISMITPDKGVEIGFERPSWSAQVDFTNGGAGSSSGSGHQVTTQLVYVQATWRLGLAASVTESALGDRRVSGLFAGVKSGPIAWLAEADLIRDESFVGGGTLGAGLFEADLRVSRGHNLKITAEYYDPDRSVSQNQQTRYSMLYEYTPIAFFQLRGGVRRYRGIPQSNVQNQRLIFVELHGYF